jgi:hypothetical protein
VKDVVEDLNLGGLQPIPRSRNRASTTLKMYILAGSRSRPTNLVLQSILEVLGHEHRHVWYGSIRKRPTQIEHSCHRGEHLYLYLSATRSHDRKRSELYSDDPLKQGQRRTKSYIIDMFRNFSTASSMAETCFGPRRSQ